MDQTTTFAVKAATAATYGGGGSAVYFGLAANEIAALGGLLIGLAGLGVNVYFKWRHLKLAERRLDLQSEGE